MVIIMDVFLITHFPAIVILILEFFKTPTMVTVVTVIYILFSKFPLLFSQKGREIYGEWQKLEQLVKEEKRAQKKKNKFWRMKSVALKRKFGIPWYIKLNMSWDGQTIYFTGKTSIFDTFGRPPKNEMWEMNSNAISPNPTFTTLRIDLYEDKSTFCLTSNKGSLNGNIVASNKKIFLLRWNLGGNLGFNLATLELNDNSLIVTLDDGEQILFERNAFKTNKYTSHLE